MVISPISRLLGLISPQIKKIAGVRFDQSRIDSLDALVLFTHTRSAYVAQTSLYGYLKARMGTKYRTIFSDPVFQEPLNTSKWKTYAACLTDLTVFCVGTISARSSLSKESSIKLAEYCLTNALDETFDDCSVDGLRRDVEDKFRQRIQFVDWVFASEMENAFTHSPNELINAAPVIDEFKDSDREIVTNSIRFRWRDVRMQFRKRCDAATLSTAWQKRDTS
ncbi:MAG: hypothetical protein AAF434_16625 [Pseudomonadota bacterium]